MSLERKYIIKLNALECGILIGFLWRHKNDPSVKVLKHVFSQLVEHDRKMKEEAGVKIEKIFEGKRTLLKMTDRDGNVVWREPYEWENY